VRKLVFHTERKHRLVVLEKRMLRRLFGPVKKEAAAE
jgi:hypothetical protein